MSATPEPNLHEPTPSDKIEREPLAEVVDAVRRDAQRSPKDYARETIVPEGGE